MSKLDELIAKYEGFDPAEVKGKKYTLCWTGSYIHVGHDGFFRTLTLEDLAERVTYEDLRDLCYRAFAVTETRKKAEDNLRQLLQYNWPMG